MAAHDLTDRTADVLNSENKDKTFEYFQFQGPLLEGLQNNGYQVPSPIQVSALPYTLAGLDVLVQSKSGTGKTLVYVLSALSSIDVESNHLQGLLIAPTREIAVQGAQTMLEIGGSVPKLKASTFIGGMSLEEDKLKLSKCHMAFGSPGRIKQLIQEGIMNVSELKLFILDEADKLCEKSFNEDIKWIMSTLPGTHQTIALSATYPNSLENTLISNLKSPTHVRLGQECQVLLGVQQFILESPTHGLVKKVVDFKFERLLKIISSVSFEQCVVFCNYSLRARALCDKLNDRGWPAIFLAGMQEQKDRLHSLQDLRTFRCRIVLTTDLSARGIDAKHVNFVVNFDVPSQGTTYLHRIGRAGRYGSKGIALTIACKGDEMKAMANIAQNTNSELRIIDDPESDLWNAETKKLKIFQAEAPDHPGGNDLESSKSPSEDSVPAPPIKDDNKVEEKVKKRGKRASKKSQKSECTPPPISKDIINLYNKKEKEFETSLSEMNEATRELSLQSILSRTIEGSLPLPQEIEDKVVDNNVPPPVIQSSFSTINSHFGASQQWAQLWRQHQLQHQSYLEYMLQCQGFIPSK